ncbi:MAG: ATP-dependent sacrificial sulfur transferase LarE [Candidatus Methanoperedens sp.]|nr:ATP-dependent sacrificial sulfur transferase LarE [Candidatus Methanoperedens sp.]MCZ7394599.1 ATP-dependent sacrificial sulfur transferase LarE [Candidatus Methanoperedens sp.]
MSNKIRLIVNALTERGSVLVAFSGGVDSAVLAALAYRALKNQAIAVTADSKTLAPGELECAKEVAKEIGLRHIVISYDELSEPEFAKNPVDRCYYCKKGLLRELKKLAALHGMNTIIEGTNISDLKNHRPGHRAVMEEEVYNPYVEFKVTKEEIRKMAHELGLSVADKPSMACLSSRFPYGQAITSEGLKRVGAAEDFLRRAGFKVVRVRDHSGIARIEIMPDEMPRFLEMREAVVSEFKRLGFSYITLDLIGFRSGSMDEVLSKL